MRSCLLLVVSPVPQLSAAAAGAEVHFFGTGHFALETHAQEIAIAIRDFLGPTLASVDGNKK